MEKRILNPATFVFRREYAMLAVLIVLVAAFSISSDKFFSVNNFLSIVNNAAIGGIIALGMTYVLMIGGIDLSVGSVVSLTTVMLGQFLVHYPVDTWLAMLIALLTGVTVGFLNGLLVVEAGVPAFIATLGMMMMVQSVASFITQGATTSLSDFRTIVLLGQGYMGPVPIPVLLFVIATITLHVLLTRTIFGVKVRAVGGNAEATRLMGLNVRAIQYAVYTMSGLMASLAGILVAGRLSMASSQAGSGWELQAITVAVLGGTSLFGGQGTISGTFIGALMVSVLFNGLVMLGVPYFYQLVATGCILIAAMVLNEFLRKG